MAGEIEVNSFKNIQLKAFAQAADQDGNYKLDSVEKKLFENLVEQAGLSMEDEFSSVMGEAASNVPDAKIQKKQERNAEKAEKQRYKDAFGKSYNEETMASVRSLEAEANTRVGNAFKEMKEYVDPKTLAAHIAKRPDVSKFNSVTDYTAALTRWVDGMEALKTKTTIEVVETGNEKLSEQMSTEHAKQNEQMTNRFDSLDEQLKGIAETVRADLIIDLQDLEIDKKSLNLEQRILKATQRISKDIKDIKAIQQQIRSLVIQDLMVDYADYSVDLQNLYETRYYGEANLSETRQTQEFDAVGKRLQNNLSNSYVIHRQETTNRMMSMYETISQSTLPHDIKMQLADKVADRAKDLYISDSEMEALEDEIKRAIQVNEEP